MIVCSGLGYYSEQAFESVHCDFKTEWEKVKVDVQHPDYQKKLATTLSRYVAKHI